MAYQPQNQANEDLLYFEEEWVSEKGLSIYIIWLLILYFVDIFFELTSSLKFHSKPHSLFFLSFLG